jgi:hypothetical protein
LGVGTQAALVLVALKAALAFKAGALNKARGRWGGRLVHRVVPGDFGFECGDIWPLEVIHGAGLHKVKGARADNVPAFWL